MRRPAPMGVRYASGAKCELYRASGPLPLAVCGWGSSRKNRFQGPLFLHRNRPKPSPIIVLSLRIFINSISVSAENSRRKFFTIKGSYMLGIILYAILGFCLGLFGIDVVAGDNQFSLTYGEFEALTAMVHYKG